MRSALTTLGIIIGVAAVIAMVEIGQGSKTAVAKTIQSMGANNLLVQPGTASAAASASAAAACMTLTPQDADAIERECARRSASVAPVVRARTQVVYGNKNWVPLYIYGTTPSFLDVRDWDDWTRASLHRPGRQQQRRGVRHRPDHRPRAVRRPVAGRPGGAHQQPPDDRHRRADPQGRQHDGRGPGRHRAGPVDARSSTRSPASPPRPATRATRRSPTTPSIPSEASQRYPSQQPSPVPGAVGARRRPTTRRRCASPTSIRSWCGVATENLIPPAIRQITALLHERHHIKAGPARRLQHPRHDRDDQGAGLDVRR